MIDICFYSNGEDPPNGPMVATKVEGMGQIHLLGEDSEPLCGARLNGMAIGAVRGELDTGHSDLCKRCLKSREAD